MSESSIQTRPAQPSDAVETARLFYETVHAVNRRDYTAEQIEAWAPRKPAESEWRQRQAGKAVYVALRDGRVIGFAELDPDGHIDCFFCHKDHQRRGVGTHLLRRLETEARERGIARLYVESSITARPFFERRGYRLVREQEVVLRDVRFTNFMMERVVGDDIETNG